MSRVLDIREGVAAADFERVLHSLEQGGVIIGPTDTLYGLLGDAFEGKAVRRIFAIRQRPEGMPLPLICADIEQVKAIAVLPDAALPLIQVYWPGPLTLVLKARDHVPDFLPAEDGTLAVRVPDHELCRRFSGRLGRPITATSANLSGQPAANRIEAIAEAVRNQVDWVLQAGPLPHTQPSTIIRFNNGKIRILREGVISRKDIGESVGEHNIE